MRFFERFVMKHGKDKYFSEMDAEKSMLYKHLSTTKFKKNRMIIHNGHTLHTDVISDEELEKTSDCIKSGRLTLNLFCNWHGTDPATEKEMMMMERNTWLNVSEETWKLDRFMTSETKPPVGHPDYMGDPIDRHYAPMLMRAKKSECSTM